MWLTQRTSLLFVVISVVKGNLLPQEVANSTEFTFDFYRSYHNFDESQILSPTSLRIMLSILYQSAQSKTKSQLAQLAYFSDDALQSGQIVAQNYNENLAKSQNITILNKIFIRENHTLRPEFINSASSYECQVESVNFKDRTATANKINQWVEEKTHGLIKNIISERLINQRTVLFLFNTIYFKAQWAAKFNKHTFNSTFYGFNNREHQVQFMTSPEYRKYTHNNFLHADILQIDYKTGAGYKFWIIQPTVETTLSNVLYLLGAEVIQDIANNLTRSGYKFSIPKFEIESEMDAKEELSNYGIEHLFNEYDLYMAEGALLKVDEATQKTKIIVNTDGTEVSTTTSSRASLKMYRPEFRFNRPFIFLILTESTNEPIFVGHYVKP